MHASDEAVYSTKSTPTSLQPRLWIWQAVSAALAVLWIFTFAFMYFASQLSTWQSLGVLKSDLLVAVQQLAQGQQGLSRRVEALEQAGTARKE